MKPKWDGTFGTLERDTFPDLVSIAIPVFGGDNPSFVAPAMRYRDGIISQSLMTNDEWDALTEEKRKALTINPEWEWKG